MPRRDGRDDDRRVKPDSTEHTRRDRGLDRHGRDRDEDRDRGSAERRERDRDRDREPRYDPIVIVEEEEPEDRNSSTTRHDRQNDQLSRGYELESTSTRRPSLQTTPSSNRPVATPRTSTTSQPQLSNFTTLLPSLSITFVSIPVGEYDKCRRFILANPEILDQDPNLYLREAAAAHRVGKIPYSRSCIQQALLIRELEDKSPRRRQHFFDLLDDEDPEVLGDFIDNFDAALAAVRRNATTTPALTTTPAPTSQRPGNVPATYSQALGGATRRTHEDNLSPAMSGMTIQPPSDRPKYNPAPFYPGDALSRGQPDSGGVRHRNSDPRRPPQTQSLVPRTRKGTTIRGTPGDREFNPDYSKRRDAKKFFRIGRVFALLWHEPAGSDRGSATSFRGENVYSSIRRMAVVRDDIHGACWAIPIHTYGNKGVAKRGFNQIDIQGHAVIHMTGTAPFTAPDEPRMTKNPIQVDPAQGHELEPMSRINFTKVHTVEHEVKVLNIGFVSKRSMPDYLKYWDEQRPSR